MLRMQFVRIGGAILLIVGCTSPPRDICTVPTPERAQSKAQIKEAYGDLADQIGSWSNLKIDYDNCLKAQAYATRRLPAPMPDVAKGILAKCADKFDVWHEVKTGSYGGMNDGLRALLDGEAEDDRKAAEREAAALVLDYQTCATGEKPALAS
jgi:hypothetical protein